MAFGISKQELALWKEAVREGRLAFLTHYWYDERFPDHDTVTKVSCHSEEVLAKWGNLHGLEDRWIDRRKDGYPHFDLLGNFQKDILQKEFEIDSPQLGVLVKRINL
ncbi:hypothetical protein [Bacillus fonticola]|uniref:hypothetical protein n=1 Tax=Bacillus fonticola TaxID=2728853 RepID=UPI001475BE96|nr:hypothetical protein [Bacillus fonticola]